MKHLSIIILFYHILILFCDVKSVIRDSMSLCLQVLALVFIRKLLDFFFTKRELSWLDDLIPESKKKKEDDKKKKAREKLVKAFSCDFNTWLSLVTEPSRQFVPNVPYKLYKMMLFCMNMCASSVNVQKYWRAFCTLCSPTLKNTHTCP